MGATFAAPLVGIQILIKEMSLLLRGYDRFAIVCIKDENEKSHMYKEVKYYFKGADQCLLIKMN